MKRIFVECLVVGCIIFGLCSCIPQQKAQSEGPPVQQILVEKSRLNFGSSYGIYLSLVENTNTEAQFLVGWDYDDSTVVIVPLDKRTGEGVANYSQLDDDRGSQ